MSRWLSPHPDGWDVKPEVPGDLASRGICLFQTLVSHNSGKPGRVVQLVVYGDNINNVNNARDTITLSWGKYNFTTNITYCVDVNQPFGMPLLVSSECGLTDTVYTFTSPGHGPCDRFNFTVTPTDGVTNGTSSEPVTGYFTPDRGLVNKVTVTALQGHPEKSILIHSNATVCNDAVSLQVDSNDVTVTNHSVSNASEISFSLPTDRRTKVTISLTNKDGVKLLFQNITISTFEVQTLTAKLVSQPNSINVSLTYAVGSSALGALIVLVPMKSNGSLDLDYRILLRSRSDDYVILRNVSPGNYILQCYDIKNIGEPETTVAASMDIYNIRGDSISPRYPMENEYVTVDETSAGICTVSCDVTMIENCLVILHSTDIKKPLKIAHLHSGNPTVDLTVEKNGDFNVVVFSGTEILLSSKITMTAKSSTEPTQMIQTSDTSIILFGYIAGALVLIVIIIIIVAAVVVIIVWRKKFTSQSASIESQINPDRTSLRYENSPLLTESGPHYETVELHETNRQETSAPVDDDAPPLPPPYKSEDSQVQNGTSSMATIDTQPKSHDSHMESDFVPEPAYDVGKRVMVKDSTNAGPLLDSTTIEHQYSEIGGSINKEGIHYALVNPKPKPEGLPDQTVDPTAVVYSEVEEEKLAPKSKESENPPQTKTARTMSTNSALPTPPPPPTAESLLSIIHSIACKWEEFGKALEIDEDRLDGFSNEAHDQVSLHDMIHYYLSNVHSKHTWEEFIQALRKIGEYECADKIVREKRLEDDQLDSEPVSSPLVPPRGLSTPQVAESELEPQSIEVGPLGTLKPEALPDQPVIPTTGVNSKENLTSGSEDGEQQSQSSTGNLRKRTTSILEFFYKGMNKETPKPGNQLVPVDHLGEQNNVSRDEETALQSNRTNNETEKFSGQPAQEDKPSLNNRTEISECVITAYDNLAK